VKVVTKLQEIKQLAEKSKGLGFIKISLDVENIEWLISQLEQAQAENDELNKRLENCMESHTRLELGKQKLRAVYDENYAKAIDRQLETERLQEENIRLTEANQKLVECLEWYARDERALLARQTLSEVKGNG